MTGLEELYNWFLNNFLWIGIYLLVLERIFWEFQPRSGEILTKVKNLITYKIGVFLFLLGCFIVFSTFIAETKGIWIYGENGWSGESTRSVILALGALGALYGLALANERLYIGGANLFNDRLSRAIEAIGHGSLAIRNSGLRLLHNLGKEAQKNGQADSDDHKLIVKILHGYIRDRAMMPQKDENDALPEPKASEERVDIVLGIELLFDLVPPAERDEVTLGNLDFRGLKFNLRQDLQKIHLDDANLQGADLSGTNLQDAHLFVANLKDAMLIDANLMGTNLSSANLEGAELRGANLQDAKLGGANLQDAKLGGANLQDAIFFLTNLHRAKLGGANLQCAKLRGVSLQVADLRHANLQGVDLEGADLHRAELGRADISDASFLKVPSLTQKQLDECFYEKGKPPTDLLEGLEVPKDRAYEWEDRDGQMCRRLVHNGEWVDTITPRWYAGGKDKDKET